MYKVLSIGGKDYKFEYSIEASLYADCTASLTGLLTDIEAARDENDIKGVLKGMANIPQTSLTLFYAGLLEHHGNHPDGDKSVADIQAAKRLIAQYMNEHADDGNGDYYSIMVMCIEQMSEDGFFKKLGLEKMMEMETLNEDTKPNRASRRAKTKVLENKS